MEETNNSLTVIEAIEQEGNAQLSKVQQVLDEGLRHQEEALDSYDGERIKYVPTPNFTDCNSSGTMLPVNMVSETILNLSAFSKRLAEKGETMTDYVMQKLHYNSKLQVCMAFSSEQVEALCLIIEQIEKNKGFILGDMAGIGKGRVVAGVLRYCYWNNLAPVFFTFGASLFSAMYYDIMDIGGLGMDEKGKVIKPKPFIMNDAKQDKDAIIISQEGEEVYYPEDKEDIYKICKRGSLPKSFNCVFLTYSQVSSTKKREGDSDNVKHSFLRKIAPNAVFVFDESHIASGVDTTIGELSREIIANSKGVLFSSATYAKNPQAFSLYVIKTALSEAQIDITKIEKAIEVGGDNVAEYIASAMVKEGQMIRRERSYEGCEISTIYKAGDESLEEARRSVYRLYDGAMGDFREIHAYLRSDEFKGAINEAVERLAERWQYELVPTQWWNKSASSVTGGIDVRERFLSDNLNKWVPKIDYDTLGAGVKFHFKENLILSVKAKLTADTILTQLSTRSEITYLDGKKYLTNRKPVVAIRSTLEAIFDKLNLQEGETISNDFSEYTKAIIKDCRRGNVTFVKVTEDYFDKNRKISVTRKNEIIKKREYQVLDEDIADGGERLNIIREKIENYTAGIPLSVIDYLREEIQGKTREEWDCISPNNPAHRNPNPNYVFLEVTGRKKMLQHIGEGRWIVTPNTKLEKRKESFNQFNSGYGDVLLINSSGSTGESAHSSEKYDDQRPRVTDLLQGELNINTETQKRGRTHRTGQVNLPAYMYIVSLIPSEIRMLLMSRKKMRKLDANTSANQVQSSNITDIRDANGDPIHDFFNKYGVNAFINDYIGLSENEYYKTIWDTLGNYSNMVDKLEDFCRLLELELSAVQEQFYNDINQKYIDEVRKQIALQSYQLELETINYKAALHARVLRSLGYGTSEFSMPTFIEDKFTLETRKTLTKEKVTATVAKLCNGLRPDEYHKQLMAEFSGEYGKYISEMITRLELKAPLRRDYEDDESYGEALTKHRNYVQAKREEYTVKMGLMESTLNYFTPNRKVLIPENFTDYQGVDAIMDMVGEGEEKKAVKGKVVSAKDKEAEAEKAEKLEKAKKDKSLIRPLPAIFMGYKIKKSGSTGNKFGESNIELHFALLDGSPPVLVLKQSKDSILLNEIRNASVQLSSFLGKSYNRDIDEWRFDPNRRYVKRFISGNILSAIVDANTMMEQERGLRTEERTLKSWELVRYTNYDGSVSTGIRLNFSTDDVIRRMGELVAKKDVDGNERVVSRFNINVPAPHDKVLEYLQLVPPIWKYINAKSINWGGYVDMLGGWIRLVRNKDFKDSYELHIYNGSENEGKVAIRKATSELYNKYYWDKDFLSILEPNFITIPSERWALNNNPKGERKNRSVFVRQYRFDFNNSRHTQIFKQAMMYMWQNDKAVLTFKTIMDENYTVENKEDVFDAADDKTKSEKIFPIGEYEYTFESTPKEGVAIPSAIKILPPSSKVGRYGGVVLSYPLEPHLLLPYSMYPTNLSYSDMVKLWLSMFDEHEKIRVLADLKKIMDENKSVREIGNWVNTETATKVADLKYVFGDLDILQVGEVMKTYYDSGDLSKISFQVEKQTSIEAPPRKRKVDYTSAEQFLIYMLS